MLKDLRIEKVDYLPKNNEGRWLTLKEAIESLNISYSTLYQKIRHGNIKAVNWREITFVLVQDKENKIIV